VPAKKNPLNTTANSRVLTPIPSKAYLAMYLLFGKGKEARKRINEMARALVLNHFLDEMEGDQFFTHDEMIKMTRFCEMPDVDISDEAMEAVLKEFNRLGQTPDGEPDPAGYIVGDLVDLLAL
jgi:hypothetical protein